MTGGTGNHRERQHEVPREYRPRDVEAAHVEAVDVQDETSGNAVASRMQSTKSPWPCRRWACLLLHKAGRCKIAELLSSMLEGKMKRLGRSDYGRRGPSLVSSLRAARWY